MRRKRLLGSNDFETKPFQVTNDMFDMRHLVGKTLVGIPEKRLKQTHEANKVLWVYDKYKGRAEWMEVNKRQEPLMYLIFQDKFGRMGSEATYRLYYYEWKPIKQLDLFSA